MLDGREPDEAEPEPAVDQHREAVEEAALDALGRAVRVPDQRVGRLRRGGDVELDEPERRRL